LAKDLTQGFGCGASCEVGGTAWRETYYQFDWFVRVDLSHGQGAHSTDAAHSQRHDKAYDLVFFRFHFVSSVAWF
jgi:hypothetical protein